MNGLIFFLNFAALVVLFLKREAILNFFEYKLGININSNIYIGLLAILLAMLLSAGMLLDNTKEKYKHISDGYNGFKPPKADNRPHKYFDVNTYD